MFFLKSLIFPIFSPAFYKEAVAKGGKKAWGVFTLFTILTSLAVFIYFAVTFGIDLIRLPDNLEDFPEFRLENGELFTTLEEPFEMTEGGQYVGVDVTGKITEIPYGYNEGVLFRQYDVVYRSEDAYGDQVLEYSEIMDNLEIDEFVLDGDVISSFVQTFGVVIIILSPFAIFVWSFLTKLFKIFIVSLLGLIVLSLLKKKNAFGKSFIIAMYASIPIVYLNFIFGLLGRLADRFLGFSSASICCLIPLFFSLVKWGIFWGIGAYGVLGEAKAKDAAKK